MTRLRFAPEFVPLILCGQKTMTFRKNKHDIGEMFELKDPETGRYRNYRVVEATRRLLGTVARDFYQEEGFTSSLEFVGWWSTHYPNEGWTPALRGWHHRFEEASP